MASRTRSTNHPSTTSSTTAKDTNSLRDTSARKPKITAARCIEYFSSILVRFDFCDTCFSSLAAVSALVKRFMAAMINTSSSVKPRVVIFHMTVSQLVRSIALSAKRRGTRKRWKSAGVSRKSISSKMLKGAKLSIVVRSYAEEVAAQYVKHSRGLSHRYSRAKL
jgi:hypothetical protein